MNTTDNAYGTRDERAYLAELARSPNAATLLSKYIASSERRVVWGTIDKTEVLLYAQLLLGNAQAAAHSAQRVVRAA
ncbi:hypothetical protein LMG19282_04220 [Cupriavidus campinensis]|uniref:hypothetical protein n=1 Tax=Cupriavidus campinensis TaxID=151783 RepID=UPI001B2AC485|nr:hypothetical protein [Cupriavidus campinensis]CAG2152574.1 hypothetical protein LMG19282_04220 [Cupriavidus campinensis]